MRGRCRGMGPINVVGARGLCVWSRPLSHGTAACWGSYVIYKDWAISDVKLLPL
jgi:hypothetical protein